MIILSIETSCDETAVAIVKFSKNNMEVLSNVVSSQIKTHSKFGGVVPSLASRMHLKNMISVLRTAFKQADKNLDIQHVANRQAFWFVDYIAVTNGPGLIPALMIGVQTAKTLSYALKKPLIGVNHIEGHIYANWIMPVDRNMLLRGEERQSNLGTAREDFNHWIAESLCVDSSNGSFQINSHNFKLWKPEFPILCLIVSGGHTQLILIKNDLNYKIIGETLDDAVGEAFDKIAKLLKLGYPGGPLIERMAKNGDKNKFNFPRPMINSNDYNFSFSGLKTAVLYNYKLEIRNWKLLKNNEEKYRMRQKILKQVQDDRLQYKSDISASFQQAVIDVLVYKTMKAAKKYKAKNIILGGGVSANKELQKQLKETINKEMPNIKYKILKANLSTDNALMIAIAAYYRVKNNKGIGNWKSVIADANLKISTMS